DRVDGRPDQHEVPEELGKHEAWEDSIPGARGGARPRPRPSAVSELFADHAPQRPFERLALLGDEFAQSEVDQRLVVAAAGRMDLFAKPCEDVVVEADRDPSLAGGHGHDRPAFAPSEVVAPLHRVGLYVRLYTALAPEPSRIDKG